ncbi:TonB-dependent receptor family protein [Oxalobacteraceae bacterium A2-2]
MTTHPMLPARSAIAIACSLMFAHAAWAQQSDIDTPVDTYPGARTVLQREQIDATGAAGVEDAMRTVPGVQVSGNGAAVGSGSSLSLGVRGLDGTYTTDSQLLLDGIPLAPAPYGMPQASFAPVLLGNLDAIEVLRGGTGPSYGPNTMGGVINFRTRAIPAAGQTVADAGARVTQYEGGNSSTQYNAFVGTRLDDGLGLALLYSGQDGKTARQHSSTTQNDVALKYSYAFTPRAQVFGKFSYADARSELPGGLTTAQFAADPLQSLRSYDAWKGRRTGADLTYVNALSDTRQLEVRTWYAKTAVISQRTDAQDASLASASRQPRYYNVLGVEPRYTQRLNIGGVSNDVSVGYRYLREKGEERALLISATTGATTTSRSTGVSTDAHAVYVEDQVAYGRWRVTPGLRYEHVEMERDNVLTAYRQELRNSKALPSLNVGYLLSPSVTLFGNYSTAFATAQHQMLALAASTDNLQPETARTAELGARYAGQQWKLDGALFHTLYSDQIVYMSASPLSYQNLGKTRHQGLEAHAEYRFAKAGPLRGFSAYASYTYTDATQRYGAYQGKDVPFYSRNVNTEGVRYQRGAWTVDVNSTYQSHQYADAANTVAESADGSVGEIAAYRLWNANISWKVPGQDQVRIQAGVNNIGNKISYTRNTDLNLGKVAGQSRSVFLQVNAGF